MIQRLSDKGDYAASENHAAQCADSNAKQAVCTEPADGGGEDDGDEIQRVFAKPKVLVKNMRAHGAGQLVCRIRNQIHSHGNTCADAGQNDSADQAEATGKQGVVNRKDIVKDLNKQAGEEACAYLQQLNPVKILSQDNCLQKNLETVEQEYNSAPSFQWIRQLILYGIEIMGETPRLVFVFIVMPRARMTMPIR